MLCKHRSRSILQQITKRAFAATGKHHDPQHYHDEAIRAYHQMQKTGTTPTTAILLAALKSCTASSDLATGLRIHSDLLQTPPLTVVSNALIHMYSKLGRIADAQLVFDSMRHRSVVSWNTLILAYADRGQGVHALDLFRRMQAERFDPTCATLVAAAKACASQRERGLDMGREIHDAAARKGMEQDLRLATALIDMYAKCGCVREARGIFDAMPERSVVTWNAIITGYAENGESGEALKLFCKMRERLSPDAQTLVAALKACACSGDLESCRLVHSLAAEGGHAVDVKVANALVHSYSKCGSLDEARRVFDAIPARLVSSWNTMIFAYAENDRGELGLQLYDRMLSEDANLVPDAITYVGALKSCANCGAKVDGESPEEKMNKAVLLEKGSFLHSRAAGSGHGANIRVACSLIDMYTKCGSLVDAFKVFDGMTNRDVASWNALIMGSALSGEANVALELFSRMQKERSSGAPAPESRTFVAVLKACVVLAATEKQRCLELVKGIHAQLVEAGFDSDNFVGGVLLDAYAKCGSMSDARTFFQHRSTPDVVSWNTMISGHSDDGQAGLAVHYFNRMQEAGVAPDELTLVSVLKACSALGALETGRRVYNEVCEAGTLPTDTLMLQTSLLDFYAKCGSMKEAEKVFDAMASKDAVSWNALIAGYAHQGNAKRVFEVFDSMTNKGKMQATGITFLSLLTVCSHAGLVEKGKEYFDLMCSKEYRNRITPIIEHYCCLVDLLSRANHLDEAVAVVRRMPFEPNPTIWRTVLAAARKWKNVEIGMLAFDALVKLQKEDSSAYVLMANTYAP